ncbi:MAG: iron-containing alcohol dehydrogenase, partial [Candidatus Korarchaeota archaeon]|nr:iron-containing alcohol dehydrogenase [Candidatus Korarchaeota archaeon]NIU83868.1 iron-containing alcohol dehydrogenase [Candidatus Thorarchaeota archaeon]
MQLPREVVVGKGVIRRIPEVFERLGFAESALIVAGKKTYKILGREVRRLLEEKGLKVDNLLVHSATMKDVHIVEDKIEALESQVVLGVGGGTKIDVAKLSSARMKVPFIS